MLMPVNLVSKYGHFFSHKFQRMTSPFANQTFPGLFPSDDGNFFKTDKNEIVISQQALKGLKLQSVQLV